MFINKLITALPKFQHCLFWILRVLLGKSCLALISDPPVCHFVSLAHFVFLHRLKPFLIKIISRYAYPLGICKTFYINSMFLSCKNSLGKVYRTLTLRIKIFPETQTKQKLLYYRVGCPTLVIHIFH